MMLVRCAAAWMWDQHKQFVLIHHVFRTTLALSRLNFVPIAVLGSLMSKCSNSIARPNRASLEGLYMFGDERSNCGNGRGSRHDIERYVDSVVS
jgi:hypothetical protein